jgi:hypothetical protein
MLTDGLVALLLTQAAVAEVVGSRIQHPPAPEDMSQYPCITYQSPSDVSQQGGDGPVGVATCRVVFDCLALRARDARLLALTLKSILNGYAGVLPDGTKVYRAESANLADRFVDGSRIYCTAFHALIQYAD